MLRTMQGPGALGLRVLRSVEEVDDVVRDLLKTGLDGLRANLGEHVAHVLHQDQLGLVSGSPQVPVQLDRLRRQDLRVVQALDEKDRRGVRSDVMCRTGKDEIQVVGLPAEGILYPRGGVAGRSLVEVRGTEDVRDCGQVARLRRVWTDISR